MPTAITRVGPAPGGVDAQDVNATKAINPSEWNVQPTMVTLVKDAGHATDETQVATKNSDLQDQVVTELNKVSGEAATKVTSPAGDGGHSKPSSDASDLTDQQWGDFKLGKLLGKGGMGSVYFGRQVSLDRPVAIKVLPVHLSADESFRARFAVEAKAVALINSQHVIQVYTAGMHNGHHYFAMEYVEGEDLSVKLRKGMKSTHRESLDLMRQAVHGLIAAGEHGIIHRDIKPANMMLTKKGMLKLMDFGLAKLAANGESDLTMAGTIMGTVSYFSPEQGRGDICDQRTDIYAIGVVLYEMLVGKLPFVGQTATSIIYQQIHQAPRPPKEIDPSIPESYQGVVLKCMQKNAADRYQTAADLLADLDAIAEGRALNFTNAAGLRVGGNLVKGVPFSSEGVAGLAKKSAGLKVGIAAGIAAVLGVSGWLAFKHSDQPTPGGVAMPSVPAGPQTPVVVVAPPPQAMASTVVGDQPPTAQQLKAAAAAEAASREQQVRSEALKKAKAEELAAAEKVKASEAAAAEQAKADEVIRRAMLETKRRLNALEQQKIAFDDQVTVIERRQAELSASFSTAQKAGGWQAAMVAQERAGTERYLAWLVDQKHSSPAWLALTTAKDFLAEKQVTEADRELADATIQVATLKEQMAINSVAMIRDPLWKTAVGFGRKGELAPVTDFVSRFQVPPAAIAELRASVKDLTTPSEMLSPDAPARIALLAQVVGDQDPLVVEVAAEQQRRGTIAAETLRVGAWSSGVDPIPADAVIQFASLATLLGTNDARVRAGDVKLEELSAVRSLVLGWADSGTLPSDAAGRIATLSALVGPKDPLVEKATTRLVASPPPNQAEQESGVAKTSSHIRGTLWGALTGNPIDNSTPVASAVPKATPVPRPEFKPVTGVVASAPVSPQGMQDIVLLTVGKDEVVETGVEYVVFRGGLYVARIRAEKMASNGVLCRVISGSANTAGVKIEINDAAQNRL